MQDNHTKTGGEKLVDEKRVGIDRNADLGDIVTVFNELKLRRKHKFMVFRLADDGSGVVNLEVVGDPKSSTDDFLSTLPTSDCRFAIYDHDYKSTDGRPQSKLFFVSWLPDNATPHNMMAYTAAKGVFREKFTGVFDVMAKSIEEIEVLLGLRKDEEEDDDDDFDFD
ncbi:hypothetical protein TrRE_jg1914 [Triparma retinervis]|uniref:ADF-H domain-containing protein n=1 Tax=Triparma retinervis TaxID=2557542 RepID=A0A9W7ANB4_9STRA|nr:hypothetical protein TrRE_jg1914 [Triparma retinervis]